jgi:cell division transport system ATP-binding protein
MIHVHHITKKFHQRTLALDQVSFSVDRGEWVFITGPSGAGKTTLLNMIFGTGKPTAGTVQLAGVDLSQASDAALRQLRQQVGFVFQNAKLVEDMTVYENVAMPLYIRGFSDSVIEKLVMNTLDQLDLSDWAGAPVETLSGGEKQKVAFARAYVTKPAIVLADEPTGNLDTKSGSVVMELFRRIHLQGTTLLLATHDDLWLRKYTKRCLHFQKGRLLRDEIFGA